MLPMRYVTFNPDDPSRPHRWLGWVYIGMHVIILGVVLVVGTWG